jgi:hypothetical protein
MNTDVSPSLGIEDTSPEEALLRLSITEVVVGSFHDEGLEGWRLSMFEFWRSKLRSLSLVGTSGELCRSRRKGKRWGRKKGGKEERRTRKRKMVYKFFLNARPCQFGNVKW